MPCAGFRRNHARRDQQLRRHDAQRHLRGHHSWTRPAPTTTIYHAGKGDDGQWRIDRFSLGRDTDEVTRLTVGQGFAKPSGWTPDGQRVDHPDDLNFADDYIAAPSERLRNEQHHAAPEHRIYIGGDIIRYILTDTGITARRIHRFADADDQLAAIRQAVNSADVT